ncbi:STAS domain-containing protein [Streptomyces sp. NPDC088358]|uniref:STAS domain-containing protein n=1 Tax=Streptomyces sp. NPDC088358 TaxID=3365857 RepID=UPI003825B0CC
MNRASANEETVTSIQGTDRPDRLSVKEHTTNGIRVVTLAGEIDHDVTDALRAIVLPADGQDPPRTALDLSAVTFMDSSGINVLVSAHQAAADANGWLRVAGAQGPVLRVIQLVGLDSVISCHPTVEQALHS